MELYSKRIESLEWNALARRAVVAAFNAARYSPDDHDVETALQEVRRRVLAPRWHEEGDRQDADRFLWRMARFEVRTILADRLGPKAGPVWQTAEPGAFDGKDDPFYGGTLLRLLGDEENPETAPYEVRFIHDEVEVGKYRADVYATPSFRIVDRSFATYNPTWRNGQRRRLNHELTTYHSHQALDHHKNRYADCLARAMPGYMSWLGMQSLKPKARRVVRFINGTHLDDAAVKRQLEIPHSTYSELMARLEARGFEEDKDREGRRVIKYNPVLDSTQRFMDSVARDRILGLSAAQAIEESPELFARVADSTRITSDDVARIARTQRAELLKAKMGRDVIERHDDRLRNFLKLCIEKPVIGKDMDLRQVDRLLSELTDTEAKEVVFKSLRFQKPILELLNEDRLLREVRVEEGEEADQLAAWAATLPPDDSERTAISAEETFADVFLAFASATKKAPVQRNALA